MRITAHWSILKPQNIIKRVHWVMDIERPFQTEEHTNMMKLKDRVEHEGIDLAKMLRKKKTCIRDSKCLIPWITKS